MTTFQAVVLAVVQAVTEFLPVSSSGHLILIPRFLGWPDQGLTFDIAVHIGTLIAAMIYFWRDIVDLVVGFFTGKPVSHSVDFAPRPMALRIVLATIPAAIAGILFQDWISTYARSVLLVACTSIIFGLLLGYADRNALQAREIGSVSWMDALLIGLAQALALVPGTSRSGITITVALILGLTRPAAARFSFLLYIPITLGAALKDILDFASGKIPGAQVRPMLIGIVVSAVVGYGVVAFLLAWLRTRRLLPFVVYRVVLGLVLIGSLLIK
jgi:undecaprenyl-diphosphatase